jgi:hypothetical protein
MREVLIVLCTVFYLHLVRFLFKFKYWLNRYSSCAQEGCITYLSLVRAMFYWNCRNGLLRGESAETVTRECV